MNSGWYLAVSFDDRNPFPPSPTAPQCGRNSNLIVGQPVGQTVLVD
jgi:hypothetical protein